MSSFDVIAWHMCSIISPAKGGIIIATSALLPQNIHISYAESERGKETVKWGEELQFIISQILFFFKFSSLSVQIILSHLNLCISVTTFIFSHLNKSNWLVIIILDDDTDEYRCESKYVLRCCIIVHFNAYTAKQLGFVYLDIYHSDFESGIFFWTPCRSHLT